ncbi:MAG: LmeA family phospholipid-binding protein [Armatimonadetes bacterium]|nr:LmeA family phospholipid-binding protein [Armatimonadota bacterium]
MLKQSTKVIQFLAVTLAVLSSAGCVNGIAQRRAEKEIGKMLPLMLGPADSYTVDVEGSAGQLRRGYIPHVHIVALNVKPDRLPRMARLEGEMTNVSVDMGAKVIKDSGPALWSGWIDDKQLAGLLTDKVTYIQDMEVQVRKDAVIVSGKITVRGVGPSGSVEGVPSIHGDREIWMTPRRVESLGLGVGVPVWGQKKVEPFINPVFTTPDSPLNIRLSSVETQDGFLKVTGSFDPKGLTEAAAQQQERSQ